MTPITLQNEQLRLVLLPGLGGGIARFERLAQGVAQPVFRARADDAYPEPNTLACYPLLPWSNRIGGGGFAFDGQRLEVASNREGEPLPIHGYGAFHAWDCLMAGERAATLSFSYQSPLWTFDARQDFQLVDNRLLLTLSIRNLGQRLPYGLGLHPFMPRVASTRLHAPATGVWLAGDDHLPLTLVAPEGPFAFGAPASLPSDQTIDNGYIGWDGHAEIVSDGVRLEVDAESACFVLYTPAGRDFFCFEPVDHPVDAFNLAGGAAANGMTVLEQGQTLTRRYQFTVSAA